MGEQLDLGIGDPSKTLFDVWDQILIYLSKKVSKPAFEGWLKDIKPLSLKDGVLEIATPSHFARDWIEKRYSTMLEKAFSDFFGTPVTLRYTVEVPAKTEHGQKQPKPSHKAKPKPVAEYQFFPLNERYTFQTFVEGKSNRLAVAGAKAVAKQPGSSYNPLFIYGGVGLGKTHLMHAIGHEVIHNNKGQVAYVTGEMFTTDYVAAIRDRKVDEFRHKYRNIDVLLLDDIQFIAEKERTEEEFFHTFNSLYQTQKQIVLCSDRAPKDLLTMDARLRSRFESGLVADIKAPELETRMAILQTKAEIEHAVLPDDVVLYMASLIKDNIRALEGALIKLLAYASLTESPITEQLAMEVLGKYFISEKPAKLTIEDIEKAVCKQLDVDVKEMNAKRRDKKTALARQMAMYLSRELTDNSLNDIGAKFGRDHSTVMHACKKIQESSMQDEEVMKLIHDVKNRLQSGS